jgi:hypothetical protein
VPRISEFYGIVIEMYYSDHPPPHFHARYAGDEATIVISSGELLAGSLPGRARDSCENGWMSTRPNWRQTGSVHATTSSQSPSSL